MLLMGQALGLDVVVEGVERQEQLDLLRGMRYDVSRAGLPAGPADAALEGLLAARGRRRHATPAAPAAARGPPAAPTAGGWPLRHPPRAFGRPRRRTFEGVRSRTTSEVPHVSPQRQHRMGRQPQDGKGRTSLDSLRRSPRSTSRSPRASPRPDRRPDRPRGADRCGARHLLLAEPRRHARPQRRHAPDPADARGGHAAQGRQRSDDHRIALTARAPVDGADQDRFAELAAEAERTCPVSKALAGTTITLDAALDS